MLIRPARGTKAFTLLELIVVIVILGILAALAIPTFARVTKRAQDATTAATVASVLRDARALVAFGDGTTWAQAVDIAVKETNSPVAVASGVSAAALSAARAGTTVNGTTVTEPSLSLAVYAASADVAVLSLKSGSGNVCIGAATVSSSTTPTCLPALSSGSSASAVLEGRALSDGVVVPLPAGATPAPTAPVVLSPSSPTGVSATATGPNAATVTWVAPSTNPSAVSSYRVVLTPATGTALTFTSAAGTTSYAVTSLSSSTAYSVTVAALATAPAVASAPSAAATVTTPAPEPGSAYAARVIADGPSSYYPLHEASGTTTSAAVGSRTASASNVTFGSGTDAFGRANRAAYFNGTSSYVGLNGTFGGTSAATVEAWVKFDGSTSGDLQAIMSASATSFIHFQAFTNGGGANAIYTNTTTALPSPVPAALVGWHHVALTTTPGSQVLYVDGAPYGTSSALAYSTISTSSTVSIGRGFQGGRFLKGYISDVAVYDKALTAAQVAAHAAAR